MANVDMELLQKYAERGGAGDVDLIMAHVREEEGVLQLKIVDYALGLIQTREGRIRMHHYLFNGTAIQRNFAAIYFKRLGITDVLREAFERGSIDAVQAFSE